ncbi:MAG: TrmH family RNA methyltransferase, partial [Christensenellales bacterium]
MGKRIESAKNPLFSMLKDLHSRKGRDLAGQFLVEGPKMVAEACKYADCRYIIVADAYEGAVPSETDAELISLPERLFDRLCDTKSPQGIAATVASSTDEPPWGTLSGLLLLLERVQDPGNVGAMIRTADAAGAAAVFLGEGCADLYAPKVVRSTMGSLFHLPVLRDVDILATLSRCRREGYVIVAGDLAGSERLDETGEKTALLIGNEGTG